MIEQGRVPMAEADLALVAAGATSHRFLELLAARDFERLIASLTSDAHARFLLPHGLEEYDGRDAIVARIRSWFGSEERRVGKECRFRRTRERAKHNAL